MGKSKEEIERRELRTGQSSTIGSKIMGKCMEGDQRMGRELGGRER